MTPIALLQLTLTGSCRLLQVLLLKFSTLAHKLENLTFVRARIFDLFNLIPMKSPSLVAVLALLSVAYGHEFHDSDDSMMDMHSSNGMSSNDPAQSLASQPTSSLNSSEIVPTAHVAHHNHGVPILETHLEPEELAFWQNYDTQTYFNAPSSHTSNLYVHVILGSLTFILLYPFVLVMKNIGSNWYLPLLSVHVVLVLISLINYSIFINSVPDLYPGNAYSPMLWILLVSTCVQYVSAIVYYGYKYYNGDDHTYYKIEDEDDISHATLFNTHSADLAGGSPSSSSSLELNENQLKTFASPKISSPFFRWLFNFGVFSKITKSLFAIDTVIFNLLNWGNFVYFLVLFPTGIAIMGEYGKGKQVFNLLAHFIKGGIFFIYGLVSLSRYCGAFTKHGWSWNHKYVTSRDSTSKLQTKGLITMEFVESFLIFFYGSTNVFLERLASDGGAWTAKDLQHASIAFIYIGCGLCGLICEFKLNGWRHEKAVDNYKLLMKKRADLENSKEINIKQNIIKASPGFSPNPFPVLTIFWTGILMSKHLQASALSTEIHTLWGTLFICACIFRLLTYVLMLIMPVNNSLTKPHRPFTELVASFCLILGGMMFMESTDPLVLTFEYYGYTVMFILNVSLGVVALLMALEMSVFAFKDWMKKTN